MISEELEKNGSGYIPLNGKIWRFKFRLEIESAKTSETKHDSRAISSCAIRKQKSMANL